MPIRSTQIIWCAILPNNFVGARLNQNALNAVFANMTGTQNKSGAVDYGRIVVRNLHPTLTLSTVRVWFKYVDARGASLAIALDGAGVVTDPVNNPVSNGAIPGTFTSPTTSGTGLAVSTFPPGAAFTIWVRRTGQNSAAISSERNTLTLSGTSPA